jgi:hypothetical protein
MRTGVAQLPLHSGKAPRWLFNRMVRLARGVLEHIVAEYGPEEALCRLSDPFWFQAFGCVLGFDWHSSGLTTTTCGAVKEGIKGGEKELGLFAAGGKGAVSRRTPQEIADACEALGIDPSALVYASRMSAKVDNAALQDGYQLYHHTFFFTAGGSWCVIQQGMNDSIRTARRYHWLSEGLRSFVNEPHLAVCCDVRGPVLNLVAEESEPVRQHSVQLATVASQEVREVIDRLPTLVLSAHHRLQLSDLNPQYLHKILLQTYEASPRSYEQLLGVRGVGLKSLRALALVSELIYGTQCSTRDPARFAFAHGGKDGTPYPVDRDTYDRTIEILHTALQRTKVDRSEKIKALKRLATFARAK